MVVRGLVGSCSSRSPLPLGAQSLTVRAVSDALHVRAPGLGFIAGPVLERLQDGRSVRVDFELAVLEKPNGAIVARAQQGFNLSFDLWEQRFAVTRIGPMPRSISHLTAARRRGLVPRQRDGAARVARPHGTRHAVLGARRVSSSGPRVDRRPGRFDVHAATLIDVLSRRREDEEQGKSVEAGPFRLSH